MELTVTYQETLINSGELPETIREDRTGHAALPRAGTPFMLNFYCCFSAGRGDEERAVLLLGRGQADTHILLEEAIALRLDTAPERCQLLQRKQAPLAVRHVVEHAPAAIDHLDVEPAADEAEVQIDYSFIRIDLIELSKVQPLGGEAGADFLDPPLPLLFGLSELLFLAALGRGLPLVADQDLDDRQDDDRQDDNAAPGDEVTNRLEALLLIARVAHFGGSLRGL